MESLLCASAVVLSGIPCFGPAPQVQAVEETVGYTEKETGATKELNLDAPENIPVNTLCEGVVGGENPTEYEDITWTDWGDAYQVEIPQEDFTDTKRGRFHLEFSTVEDSADGFSIQVVPKGEMTNSDDYYSATITGRTVTPSYSFYGPVEIQIRPNDSDKHHNYRFKVVYEILENDETGKWGETELNASESNAASIEVNQDYWGCLQGVLASNKLWYQYTLDRPGKVNVAIKPQDGKKPIVEDLWQIAVHDGEGYSTEYLSGQNASGVISDTIMMDPGTYFIEVYSFADFAIGQIFDLRVNYEELSSQNTATPKPAATPEATGEPEASAAPIVTGTPNPTGEPEASAAPIVTRTPNPTGEPEASAAPVVTGTPNPTDKPKASAAPVVTGTPNPTGEPEASATPVVTGAPNPAESSKAPDQPVTLIKEEGTTTVERTIKEITNTRVIQVTMKVSSKKKVALKWKKNKVAQGYQIYRSMKKGKGFKCVKVVKNRNTTKWTDTKVKKGKIYYYKLRAYKKVGKKTYYSKFTKILKIRAK